MLGVFFSFSPLSLGITNFSETGWQASLWNCPVSLSPVLGLQEHTITPGFLCGSRVSNSGLYVCVAQSLSIEPPHYLQ